MSMLRKRNIRGGCRPAYGSSADPPPGRRRSFEGSEDEARDFVIDCNIKRRHLDATQRADAVYLLMPKLREEAKERQSHGETGPGKTLPAKLPEALSGESRDKCAAVARVSPRTMQDVATTREKGVPELAAEMKKGTVVAALAYPVSSSMPVCRSRAMVVKPQFAREEQMMGGIRERCGLGALTLLIAAGAMRDQTPPAGRPLSGASGGDTAKAFADWRGTPIQVAGTWADVDPAEAPAWAVGEGSQWGWWTGPIDIALGGPRAKTWTQAADGELDGEWRAKLESLKSAWAPRDPANLYVRFAHEFNGNFMPWSVAEKDVGAYKRAFARFTAMQRRIIPRSKAVWSPNAGTNQAYDVRTTYPGGEWVDVIGVDWYNSWPWVDTAGDFRAKIDMRQESGGPVGIEQWRQFAAGVGKPLALPEWGNDSVGAAKSNEPAEGGGDAPEFFREFRAWLDEHGGEGPGRVLYEVYFNIEQGYPGSEFWLTNGAGATNPRMPRSAAVYRELW